MIKETLISTKFNIPYIKAKLAGLFGNNRGVTDLPGHLTLVECIALADRTSRLSSDSVVLEIGSYLGLSSSLICKNLNADSKLYCIDTWENDAMSEGKRDTYELFNKNMQAYANRFVALRGRSDVVVKSWDTPIDFLWIDGDHSYEGCYADLSNWFPFVKKGGWVGLHDYRHPCGVKDAVAKYFINTPRRYYFAGSILLLKND